MSLPGRIALVAILLALTAPAHAEQVATATGTVLGVPQPAGVAVVWGELGEDHRATILRGAPGTAPSPVASLPAPFAANPGEFLVRSLLVAASPSAVGVSDVTGSFRDEGKGGIATIRTAKALLAGPPTGPLAQLAGCDSQGCVCPTGDDAPAPVAVTGSLVVAGDLCDRTTIRVYDTVTGAVESIATGSAFGIVGLRAAGRFVSWIPYSEAGYTTVRVYDRDADAVVLETAPLAGFVPAPSVGYGLQEDGTLAVAGLPRVGAAATSRIAVYSLASPSGRLLPARAGDRGVREVLLAGDRVAYLARPEPPNRLTNDRDEEIVVGDLSGSWEPVARFASQALLLGRGYQFSSDTEHYGFDGATLTWATNRCDATTIDRTAIDAPALTPPADDCGRAGSFAQPLIVRRGAVGVRLRCPGACRGELSGSAGRFTRSIRFRRASGGVFRVRLPLDPGVRRKLAAGRTVLLEVSMTTDAGAGAIAAYAGRARLRTSG